MIEMVRGGLCHKHRVHADARSAKGRYRRAVRVAKERNIPWDLTERQYNTLVRRNRCSYGCGNPLPPTGVGLDRFDNSKGYTPSNAVPCCTACNKGKGEAFSGDEWQAMIDGLIRFRFKN